MAGTVQLVGSATRLESGLSNGYGFAGIIVAALALMRPSGVAAVAFAFGAVQVGGQSIQTLGVSSAISDILQAMILFGALVAAVFFNYRIRWTGPASPAPPRAEGEMTVTAGAAGAGVEMTVTARAAGTGSERSVEAAGDV